MSIFFRDRFQSGLLTGSLLPLLGLALVHGLNWFMVETYVIGSPDAPWIGFQDRTMAIMAICINLIPAGIANRRYMSEFIRGLMIPTVLAAFAWFFYYGKILFSSF